MQPTLVLRAAKHMGVIGLPWQPICQGTEQEQTPGMLHPGLDTPAYSALSSLEIFIQYHNIKHIRSGV